MSEVTIAATSRTRVARCAQTHLICSTIPPVTRKATDRTTIMADSSERSIPEFDDVLGAHERITPYIHRTPVLTSSYLNELSGAQLFFKCENFQKGGAFKARGAANAVFGLSEEAAACGVATHSSGNHALCLSYAARARGIKASVVMPHNAPNAKKAAVRSYGVISLNASLRWPHGRPC